MDAPRIPGGAVPPGVIDVSLALEVIGPVVSRRFGCILRLGARFRLERLRKGCLSPSRQDQLRGEQVKAPNNLKVGTQALLSFGRVVVLLVEQRALDLDGLAFGRPDILKRLMSLHGRTRRELHPP